MPPLAQPNRRAEPLAVLDLCGEPLPAVEKVLQELEQKGIPCCRGLAEGPAHLLMVYDRCPEESEWAIQARAHLQQGRQVLALEAGSGRLPLAESLRWLDLGVKEILRLSEMPRPAEAIAQRVQRWSIVDKVLESEHVRQAAVGSSARWRQALRQAVEAACFSESNILLLGESGTGKELIAGLIHELDRRPDKGGLVVLDSTTVVPDLSGSEFFGHEKGAYTNAISMREGAFGQANGGTLFLDEVGELPLPLQAALLRVIQEGAYKRVGSNQWRKTQFRLICATNRDLKQEMAQGRFRQDLYFRIATEVCILPPLRERREDILELAEFFLRQALKRSTPPPLGQHLRSFLLTHDYPGNVRELSQLIHRLALRYPGEGPLTLGCLPPDDRALLPDPQRRFEEYLRNALRIALANGTCLKELKRLTTEMAIDLAIEAAGDNLQAAARQLDVTDRMLQMHRAGKRGG
jgi:transcriptional regulator with GAF, ATPase, and Fis domain